MVKYISIPKWSDFNEHYLKYNDHFKAISIPKWSDFNNNKVVCFDDESSKFQSQNGLILTGPKFHLK